MLKQTTLFDAWKISNANESFQNNDTNFDVGDDELLCVAKQSEERADDGKCFSVSAGATEIYTQAVIPGFDTEAGKTWEYPINFPERQYQLRIVEQALFRNTLVVLPTGLGKTFIAAVVMFNFYRWYPNSKVVFMAPTKPLVTQQIEACSKVMGIEPKHIIEMTGSMSPAERLKLWRDEKRIFFLTPHILVNDLSMAPELAASIKCLVIDEAHKATGNYAYTHAVRIVKQATNDFRILALSATPGNDFQSVQKIITNLMIAHVEIRSEESADVRPYCQNRKIEPIIVKLSEEMKNYKCVLESIVMRSITRLQSMGCLYYREVSGWSKFLLLQCREQFRKNPPQSVMAPKAKGIAENDFALSISLCHACELLTQHGLRSLYFYLKDLLVGNKGFSRLKTELLCNSSFTSLFDELRSRYDDEINTSTQLQKKENLISAHPKLKMVRDIVVQHFQQEKDLSSQSRIIVFSKFRESVHEITEVLSLEKPLVRPVSFVGHSSTNKRRKGITQKEQTEVLRYFSDGCYNTLIATCVAEEGLDIGDVNLIICFDTNRSPIRLIQRMGRTGRKRAGKIILLLTEGKEANSYTVCDGARKRLGKFFQDMRKLHFYRSNPRMIPLRLNPVCRKVTVEPHEIKIIKKQSSERMNKALISEEELEFWKQCIWPLGKICSDIRAFLARCTKRKCESSHTYEVGHSLRTNTYFRLLSSFNDIRCNNMLYKIITPNVDDLEDFQDSKKQQTRIVTLDKWLVSELPLPDIASPDHELLFTDFLEDCFENCTNGNIVLSLPVPIDFKNLNSVSLDINSFECVDFKALISAFDLSRNFLKDMSLVTPISEFDTIKSNEDFMSETSMHFINKCAVVVDDAMSQNFVFSDYLEKSVDSSLTLNSGCTNDIDDMIEENVRHGESSTMLPHQEFNFNIGDLSAIKCKDDWERSNHTSAHYKDEALVSETQICFHENSTALRDEEKENSIFGLGEQAGPSSDTKFRYLYQRSSSPILFRQPLKRAKPSDCADVASITNRLSPPNSSRHCFSDAFCCHDSENSSTPAQNNGSVVAEHVTSMTQTKPVVMNGEVKRNSFSSTELAANGSLSPCSVQKLPMEENIVLFEEAKVSAFGDSESVCEQTLLDFTVFESYDELFKTFSISHNDTVENKNCTKFTDSALNCMRDSDDDFCSPAAVRRRLSAEKKQTGKFSNSKKPAETSTPVTCREFLLTQAEVSEADCSDTHSEEMVVTSSDDSFIDDSELDLDYSRNYEMYIKSIQSPETKTNQRRLRPLTMDVYSQAPTSDPSYVLDSFCVEDVDEKPDVTGNEDVFTQTSVSPRKTRRGTSLEILSKKKIRRILSSSESD